MNIPGYYYDEVKKRYFKITNGSHHQPYHNNQVQKSHRSEIIKSKYENVDKFTHKKVNQHQSLKYKLLYQHDTLNNIQLGLTRPSYSTIEYERFNTIRLNHWVTYPHEARIWGKLTIGNNDYILLTNQFKQFQILSYHDVINNLQVKSINHENMVEEIRFNDDINEIIHRIGLLPVEILSVTLMENYYFINLISESDLDNPKIYQNFILFGKIIGVNQINKKFIKQDKNLIIFKFLNNLPNGEIKKDLQHLFGMNIIEFSNDEKNYQYRSTDIKPTNRFFITFSKFFDKYLILGTNLGIVYLLQYDLDHNNLNNDLQFNDIIKFKINNIKIDKINQIEMFNEFIFISSFRFLIILNIENNQRFIFNNYELIKNFKVFKILDHFRMVIVSYKKIDLVNFSLDKKKFEIFNSFDYVNDNIINLFSIITIKNIVILNQSNNSLLIVNLNNFKFKKIDLENINQKINGIWRLNEHYLLINFKNGDNSSHFNFYQI